MTALFLAAGPPVLARQAPGERPPGRAGLPAGKVRGKKGAAFTWRPTEHFFVQAGAGYYQLGSKGEPTFMCRANLLYPSPRRGRD